MFSRNTLAAMVASLFFGSTATLAHDHNHEVRHAAAHVHGEGELSLVVENTEMHLELMMPAHDILGFETIATDAQQKQLDETLAQLESGDLWIPSAQAQCQLVKAQAKTSNDSHSHDHKHDHGHKHDHEQGPECNHDDHGAHMDIMVSYVYECKNTAQLTDLTTQIFKQFPRSEKIRVQGLTDKGSVFTEISPRQPQVKF